jgi:hypothetical protein
LRDRGNGRRSDEGNQRSSQPGTRCLRPRMGPGRRRRTRDGSDHRPRHRSCVARR